MSHTPDGAPNPSTTGFAGSSNKTGAPSGRVPTESAESRIAQILEAENRPVGGVCPACGEPIGYGPYAISGGFRVHRGCVPREEPSTVIEDVKNMGLREALDAFVASYYDDSTWDEPPEGDGEHVRSVILGALEDLLGGAPKSNAEIIDEAAERIFAAPARTESEEPPSRFFTENGLGSVEIRDGVEIRTGVYAESGGRARDESIQAGGRAYLGVIGATLDKPAESTNAIEKAEPERPAPPDGY